MMKGIDISNWQRGFDLGVARPEFVIVKATEGLTFIDKCCDGFVQDAINLGIPFGYYHFARSNSAEAEAAFFYEQTKGYTGKGIPVLDLEVPNGNAWAEAFCKKFYELSGVKPWFYASSDYINNRGYGTTWIKENCGLWIAGYPKKRTSYPESAKCPYRHDGWTLAAWQFTDCLATGGMEVDASFFYGDKTAWNRYASGDGQASATDSASTLELATKVINGEYGTGTARRDALGSRYNEVQAKVNDLYAKANDVIEGKYGNGQTRKEKLGSEYTIVQRIVNDILSN